MRLTRSEGTDSSPRPLAPGAVKMHSQVIKEKGERQSVPDAATVIKSLGHLLQVWELNRQYRLKRIAGSRGDRLKGLFGGG